MSADPYRGHTYDPGPPPLPVDLDALQTAQRQAISAITAKTAQPVGERCAWCREHAVDEIEVDIARGRDQRAYDGMAVCSACGRTQP